MNYAGDFFIIFRTHIPGGDRGHPGTESAEKNHQHHVQCNACTHRSGGGNTCLFRGKLTEYDQVRRIKQKADEVRSHQRQRETEDLAEKGAVTHVHLVFFSVVHIEALFTMT